jgi:hypothetical protein
VAGDWRDLIEARIRDARARGLFDRLRGRGRPAEDPLAGLPAEARMEARVAASVGGAPAEVDRMRTLRVLREQLATATDEDQRARLRRAIRDAEIELNVLLEKTGRAILIEGATPPRDRDDY